MDSWQVFWCSTLNQALLHWLNILLHGVLHCLWYSNFWPATLVLDSHITLFPVEKKMYNCINIKFFTMKMAKTFSRKLHHIMWCLQQKEKKLNENRFLKALNCHCVSMNMTVSQAGLTKLYTTEQAEVWIFNRNATWNPVPQRRSNHKRKRGLELYPSTINWKDIIKKDKCLHGVQTWP